MSELEEKLGNILSDPNMMQQIMGMAQMLSPKPQENQPQKPQNQEDSQQMFDPRMLQAISSIAGQGGIDGNQQSLLKALQPYLSRERIGKLERAMSAARMAGAASAFLGAGGLQMLTRR